MSNLQERADEALATINEDTDAAQWFAAMDMLEQLGRWQREKLAELKAVGLEHVQRHGPLVRDTVKFYAGVDKDYRCRDAGKTFCQLFMLAEGDEDAITACLSSNAWKPAAVRKMLAEYGQEAAFDALFETVEKGVLKSGVVQKQLLKTDSKFLR